jgi:hypothetical protein
MADAHGEELITREHTARRTPLAAATPELLSQVQKARSAFD